MRPLEELRTDEPAWPGVLAAVAAAPNPVVVLPGDQEGGERTLLQLQVTDRSPMGALALHTSGLLVDHGWLRLLGGAASGVQGNLASWNGLGDDVLVSGVGNGLLVGHDAIGGFFALDGGAFGEGLGNVFYAAPDTLQWEPLGMGYSGLLEWCLNGDLASFYEALRWPGWRDEVALLGSDEGLFLYPPPFTAEGQDTASAHRGVVPMRELWGAYWGDEGFVQQTSR